MKQPITILVVDDTPDNLAIVSNHLKDYYTVKVANNGEKALRIASSDSKPDLILLDIMMSGMDGYEVCKELKRNPETSEIPVIFLTAKTELEDEKYGLELGAVDYIGKPISPPILLARVKTHLHLKLASDFLKDQNHFLEQEVQRRTEQIVTLQETAIIALASLAEARDNETGNHLRRTQFYIKALCMGLKEHPRFKAFLTDANISLIFKSSPLHDIGKVGIPDHILLKPGRLTTEEFEVMKTHAVIGYEAIVRAENSIGAKVDFLQIAKDIVLYHHEKWDGSGYPKGFKGEEIPIPARLMALADVYDALISKRVYKDKINLQTASEIIREGREKHFDPDVVDCFFSNQPEFEKIAASFP